MGKFDGFFPHIRTFVGMLIGSLLTVKYVIDFFMNISVMPMKLHQNYFVISLLRLILANAGLIRGILNFHCSPIVITTIGYCFLLLIKMLQFPAEC